MKTLLIEKIKQLTKDSPLNRDENGNHYFDEPLIGFASAEDPLFAKYKEVIGLFHLTPQEVFEQNFGSESWNGGTVISWVLPIAENIRLSNRKEKSYPSRSWAHTRFYGEQFNVSLRKDITQFLSDTGNMAIAPQLSNKWKEVDVPNQGPASTWSERHAAFAAGLGTFSINDGLITEKGIAHRCGSLITDLLLDPSPRPYEEHTDYCLLCRENKCGACIARCPVGALSGDGHDKMKCRDYTYGTISELLNDKYGVAISGCGLCQTKVPCEARIP